VKLKLSTHYGTSAKRMATCTELSLPLKQKVKCQNNRTQMTYISQLEEKVFLSANLSAGVSICLRIDRIIESLFVECVVLLCCNIITQLPQCTTTSEAEVPEKRVS
jgi:hypothetical protein